MAIRLGMEGGRPVGMDAHELEKTGPEVGGENGIAVADEAGWKAMNPDGVLYEQLRHVRRRHGFFRRDEVGLFCESVHDHLDRVVVVRGR